MRNSSSRKTKPLKPNCPRCKSTRFKIGKEHIWDYGIRYRKYYCTKCGCLISLLQKK